MEKGWFVEIAASQTKPYLVSFWQHAGVELFVADMMAKKSARQDDCVSLSTSKYPK